MNLTLVSGYANDSRLRHSFNRLARQTFDLDFEPWYDRGLWSDAYVCHSYVTGDGRVVANVSVNRMPLVLNGQPVEALQIGTVMTDPAYRNRGLSRALFENAMGQHGGADKLVYLFANHSVLDFYPKFRFERIAQKGFTMERRVLDTNKSGEMRKLDLNNRRDFDLLFNLAAERQPVSDVFGVVGNPGLVMFHALYAHPDNLYYDEAQQTAVMCALEDDTLWVYDIISAGRVDFTALGPRIIPAAAKTVRFAFTPDKLGVAAIETSHDAEEVLFARPAERIPACGFQAPSTAQA